MSRITHFEIHASNPPALIAFYTEVLGWKFTKWQMAEYWLITTGPADQPGINGGLLQRPACAGKDSPWTNAFVCTAQVDSLEDTLEKADQLGAVVALPTMPVTGVGWLAYIKDPDGNVLGLMQPDPTAK
jgi:predicted enzyme related to lactoylglutathione lyase